MTLTTRCAEHTAAAWAGSDRGARLPKGWAKLRSRIIKRDGYRCVECKGTVRLEVDHVINNDDHATSNLQTLCHACHQAKTLREAQVGRYGPAHGYGRTG